MANRELYKDIYDESYFPPILKKAGNSVTLFKRYFYESDCPRKPVVESSSVDNKTWVTRCNLFQPAEVSFTGTSLRKKDSESIAMAKALMWLRDNNFVDNSFNAIKYNEQQIRQFYEQTSASIEITAIDDKLKTEMNRFCEDFNNNLRDRIVEICAEQTNGKLSSDEEVDTEFVGGDHNQNVTKDTKKSQNIKNILNNRKYEEPDEMDLIHREVALNLFLNQRKEREKSDPNFASLRQKVSELPINRYNEQILETISQNRVIVISGDTGCGKTTQVPQMIFENEIKNQRSAFADIIVTEPRRLSAISISERIAVEFGERNIGNSIGYNVRFDKTLPKWSNGYILFCSAGILLRKMGSNPGLKGVSHVIIDEVHERDVIIDFLLVLLKRALTLNPNIKIILMSASMNANLFVEYFDCPLIEIPGRCYEVKDFYLNDFIHKIPYNSMKSISPTNPKLDPYLTIALIDYIDRTKGDGAILVFLPGWAEIQSVSNLLNEKICDSSHLMVVPVHSKLSHSNQKQIFAKTGAGIRKVILSTNIAETSLTIDDVVYVIDSGLAKEMRYNPKLNVSNFGTHWISKANATQRKGRAGRVKEGECYRLYTREIESVYMDEFPTPELLRIPLENVVMQSKLHCPKELVSNFLSAVPQPPSQKAIEKALNSLKEIKVLNNSEELTLLGQRIVNFTTHPRLSVALVYSSFFCCLKSMLALVSQLSESREPFQVLPDQKFLIRQIKNNFSFDFLSDHISLVGLSLEYQTLCEQKLFEQLKAFREENHLHWYTMENIMQTMKLYVSDLEESKLIGTNSWNNVSSDVNFNWHQKYLLVSALVPAFVPNFVRLVRGDVKKGKVKNNAIQAIDVISESKVKFSGESVFNINFNACGQLERLCNSLVVYFKSFYSEDSRMLTICDASLISPISLLLFSNHKFDKKCIQIINEEECVVSLRNNKYLSLRMKREDLKLITRWTTVLDLLFQWFLISRHLSESDKEENYKIYLYLHDFLQYTEQLIRESS